MELHVKVLAVLCIVYGAFGLVMPLLMLVVFCGVTGLIGIAAVEEPEALLAVPIIGAIGTFIIGFMLALSVPRIVAGFGLLGRRPWSRILAIVLSVLGLVNVPFGTALGAYGLWGSCRRPRGRWENHRPTPDTLRGVPLVLRSFGWSLAATDGKVPGFPVDADRGCPSLPGRRSSVGRAADS